MSIYIESEEIMQQVINKNLPGLNYNKLCTIDTTIVVVRSVSAVIIFGTKLTQEHENQINILAFLVCSDY